MGPLDPSPYCLPPTHDARIAGGPKLVTASVTVAESDVGENIIRKLS